MTETTTTQDRVFWPKDYARLADGLRRARKDKRPGQLARVDEMAVTLAQPLTEDNPGFDTAKFTAAVRLRIETVHFQEFTAWAAARGYSTAAEDAPQYYTEFYATRYSSHASLEDEDDEDDKDEDE